MLFSKSLFASLLSVCSVLAAPAKDCKKDETFVIPSYGASARNSRGPPYWHYQDMNFTVIDNYDKKHAKVKPFETYCYAKWVDYAPNATSPSVCDNKAFTWYFARYRSISDFVLNIQHTYKDPAYGPKPVTFYGEGSTVNFTTVHITYICAASGTGCYADFDNSTNPIVVPIKDVK